MIDPEARRKASAREVAGWRAWGEGDLTRAEHNFREALAGFSLLDDVPGAGRILVSLARLRLAEGEPQAATELSGQAVSRTPGDVAALTVLGYARWMNGSPADAEVTFGQAVRRDRSAVRALAGRGQVRAELGDHSRALNDLDQALESELVIEDEAEVRSARALALAGLRRFDEARQEIAAALEKGPSSDRIALRAGWIAVLEGRLDDVADGLAELENNRDLSISLSARRLVARCRSAAMSE